MSKYIAIVMGEPNSINSEILFKSWNNFKKYKKIKIIIIGNISILNKQMKHLKFKFNLISVKENFHNMKYKKKDIPVINIELNQKKKFQKISSSSNAFINLSFKKSIDLIKKKQNNRHN